MDYIYLMERIANKNVDYNELDTNILYILGYHIETQCKYPFLLFMMEKIPFCNNLIKEQFVLPHIIVNDTSKSIKTLALEKVKHSLHSISNKVTDDMYKGILWSKDPYVLINMSHININGLELSRNSSNWFILPSEIINTKKVCGIDIDNDVVNLFTHNPKLAILTNPKTKGIYVIPDAVYNGGKRKKVEFNSIFGNEKTKTYESCAKHYYFYRTFFPNDIEGINIEGINIEGINIEGINRYALFVEGELYIESEKEFSLTDEIIEKMYPEPCIIICYRNSDNVMPDMLVKKDTSFISLSYHMVNVN